MTAEFVAAVHAVVYLNIKGACATSGQIAENVCTNPARIRKIMSKLRDAGIVLSRPSREGGYTLGSPADKITLCDILEATDRHIAEVDWRSGSEERKCPISRQMRPVIDNIFESINNAGRAALAGKTIAGISERVSGGEIIGLIGDTGDNNNEPFGNS